ncbi:hypothetical protein IGB42_00377 [Andreprevotia sp. IGB-42]|uniref:type VI secretion system baseplate subunit TssK n=1 Tax=Andreprevotia sp. IGB-42 TaxID=2497473 RepID=UPI001359797A|nr:type VI secretion system baseplate subunit TssK [Andreprevotia sp. IGB-42]KAF0815296.1 hypothetical protein IGB42_00377 [Andreprevotia sp. IGB-42]
MPNEYLPNSLQWSDGLLLSPQHLQQNDIYWHQRLHYTAQSLDPSGWGIRSLSLDTERLQHGLVYIGTLEAILSDGSVIQYPGNFSQIQPAQPLALDIASVITTGTPLRIWLTLPQRGSMAAARSNPQRRFLSYRDDNVTDESAEAAQEAVAVDRLVPRLTLYAGVTPPALHDWCPLLEVMRDADNRYSLTPYHPPLLCMGAAAFLGEASLQKRVVALKKTMWEKLRELARESGADQVSASEPATELATDQLIVVRHLAMSLPLLSIMADSAWSRPLDMYALLAQVAGQVAPIGDNPLPPMLDAYDHQECYAQFDTVIRYISRKIESINTQYITLTFARLRQHAGFGLRLPGFAGDELVIELKPRDGQSLQSLSHWLDGCVICAVELSKELLDRRVSGAHRRMLDPKEITRRGLRRGGLFFVLRNERVQLGQQMRPVFSAGDTLLIRNHDHQRHAPADIILHCLRQQQATAHTSTMQEDDDEDAPVLFEVSDAR